MLVRHPAFTIPFDELYAGLQQEVANGNITCSKHPQYDLELYDYSIQCTMAKAWNLFTRSARGLIVCPSQKKIVARTLPKFKNYMEEPIPDETKVLPFTILSKEDGSCGIIWFWDNKWHVSTRGSFFSDQAIWAEKFLHENLKVDNLDKNNTYIAEIIYPENRIVIAYDYEALVLITAYDSEGYEVGADRQFCVETAQNVGFKLPKEYNYTSIEQMVKVCEILSSQEEGFVVRFSDGFRIKVKSKRYCEVHSIISRNTPLAIWEAMSDAMDLNLIRCELPEELQRDFDLMVGLLTDKFNSYLIKIKALFGATMHLSDKELSLSNTEMKSYIFACRKHNFLEMVNKESSQRKSLFNLFRPTGNRLENYTPSTAMNRFSKADEES